MRRLLPKKSARQLKGELAETDRQLGQLNRELAAQMIVLASQTGDIEPLKEAVETLRKAKRYYSQDNAPREHAEVQQALADTLFTLGRSNKDRVALEQAKAAYRGAITLASMIGDDELREELRTNYKLTLSLLGEGKKRSVTDQSLFKVA